MVDLKATLIFLTSLVITMFYFNCYDHIKNDNRTVQKREIKEPIYDYKGTEAFLINTSGCYIPNYGKKLKFKETSDRKKSCGRRAVFVRKKYNKRRKAVLVFRIDRDKMLHYVNKKQKYECCYSFVVRSNKPGYEDSRISYAKCKSFKNGSKIFLTQEVILVKCFTKDIEPNRTKRSTLYEDAYIFVKKQSKNSMNYIKKKWNVLIIGIDTMSRARIIAAMPKLVKYMRALGWLDYKGYQKIDQNTFPNLMAVLTGKNYTKVDQACSLGMETCNDLIAWSTFRKAGYITAFGEDNVQLPDTFSRYHGFRTSPTHHYMRPFFLTGESQRGNVICTKHQSSGKHIFDYAFDFANTYKKYKFFGTFWINSFSHNSDYLPSRFENDTIDFFEKISKSVIKDNTFIVLLSDHGIRFGPMRIPVESYYAERLPMLFVWVPTEFRKMHEEKYYNLQLNQNRLVTPYDIYVTLVNISNISRSSPDIISEACPLCSSIFKEKSSSRTCAEAGVSNKWCSCHTMKNANTFKDIDAVNSVRLAVSHVQNYTLHVKTSACRKCRPLRLHRVFRVHSYINQNNKKQYVIAFQMVADDNTGGAEMPKLSYEATILKDKNKLSVLGLVDPISPYNFKGYCVKKRRDLGYCICKTVKCV